MSTISKQEYMKPFQYDSVKRAWSNFYEEHFLKVLEFKNNHQKQNLPCIKKTK